MSKINNRMLFDEESDEEVTFRTESDYAKKYDKWREKEEIHKLEQKYGPDALNSGASASSDSEDESDEPPEVSEESEAQFLKTLALLKTKDPRIYDPGYQFFEEKKEQEKDPKGLKASFTFEDSDDDDDDDGDIFTIEKKAEIGDEKQDEASTSKEAIKGGGLKEYLSGAEARVDEDTERELAPLRALWTDPRLGEGEAFLRDYILNQKYLEEGSAGEAEGRLRDDEDLEEDERRVEEQGHFERAYNFRFEEPDDEYLKRFPRTMNYVRPKDDRRSRKRAELRERKDEEKRRKMEDIGRLKALKLKEIHEKLARIREVTGNEDLAFEEEDIEADFDPAQHDRRMRAVFDEQYYGGADEVKPEFPDLDEELEIENWDHYEPVRDRGAALHPGTDEEETHCEDQEFNMDADYDPKRARSNLLEEIKSNLGKKRRNRKKKSKLASLLSTAKPTFVPLVDSRPYSEYMEEYYKMDCEDVIGDLPTRFKYRDVVANDFGLSVEEILLADDKELTQWVPLKRLVRHRPADVERSEVNTYRQKAADRTLKRKILPSLFKELPEEPDLVIPVEEANKKKKKKKKKNKNKEKQIIEDSEQNNTENIDQSNETQIEDNTEIVNKKKKKKHKELEEFSNQNDEKWVEDSSEVVDRSRKKKTHKDIEECTNYTNETQIEDSSEGFHKKKNKKRKVMEEHTNQNEKQVEDSSEVIHKKKKLKEIPEFNDSNVKETIMKVPNKKNYKENNLEFSNKQHKRKKNEELKADESCIKANEITEIRKERNKKKNLQILGGFIVESIQKEEPSLGNINDSSAHNSKKKNPFTVEISNLKHKLDAKDVEVPSKKNKNNNTRNKSKMNKKKDFKTKFKQKDKFKSKQGKDISSDNPLSNLSDERLKAYGLNPKKYRSFLKYKKF